MPSSRWARRSSQRSRAADHASRRVCTSMRVETRVVASSSAARAASSAVSAACTAARSAGSRTAAVWASATTRSCAASRSGQVAAVREACGAGGVEGLDAAPEAADVAAHRGGAVDLRQEGARGRRLVTELAGQQCGALAPAGHRRPGGAGRVERTLGLLGREGRATGGLEDVAQTLGPPSGVPLDPVRSQLRLARDQHGEFPLRPLTAGVPLVERTGGGELGVHRTDGRGRGLGVRLGLRQPVGCGDLTRSTHGSTWLPGPPPTSSGASSSGTSTSAIWATRASRVLSPARWMPMRSRAAERSSASQSSARANRPTSNRVRSSSARCSGSARRKRAKSPCGSSTTWQNWCTSRPRRVRRCSEPSSMRVLTGSHPPSVIR